MKSFYKGVVNHPKLILIIFGLCAALGLFCRQSVSVNYDINNYLPEDSASTVALDIIDEEYDGGIPNARVMIQDVSIPEALAYKKDLSRIDGVLEVTWLDDMADITEPLEMADQKLTETYYKDGSASYSITLEEDKRIKAVEEIRTLIGDENAMSGTAVSTAVATTSTVTEVAQIAMIAVAFVLLVLLLTTTSWIEPLIILLGLGVAVAINMGSNLVFGEISFVSNAAGSILQLAVSLDYSVFLIHRFEECRKKTEDANDAMVDALCMSTSSILSSGLTTVIGFLALCLMRFGIGPDMGLVLAKGVAISLLTVFLFTPVLVLATYRLIDKTRHRSFMPSFKGLGRAICRIMLPMVCVFAVLIVPSYLASGSNSFYYGASRIFGPDTKLGADTEKIEATFGKNDTYILLLPKDDTAVQKELSDQLHALPQVTGILSYVDSVGAEIPEEYLDTGALSKLNSENYTRMVLSVDAAYEGEETFSLIEEIRNLAEDSYPGAWHLAGEGVSTYDLMATVTADMVKVNLVAIGAVFLVLLFTMKSVALPVILVLSIETAIWINLSIPYFADNTIFYLAYLIISSIQLGATVDYAILFTDRYRELRQELDRKEAITGTVSAVTVSILTSGSVLTVVGFLMGIISTHGLLSQIGYFLGKGTLCSLAVVLFVLPGLLYLFDRWAVRQPRKIKRNKTKTIQQNKEAFSK